MRIEILNTGTELLLGSVLNTHGQWFGRELFKLGLRAARMTTAPDGEAIATVLRECVSRADAVIVTGGLGPTSDDVTREAAAEVLGVELIEDEAALRSLEAFFAVRRRPMAEANLKQAQVPVGADVLPNANGTAPGIYVPPRLNGAANCAVFLLPGPPRELYPMFHEEVAPRLRALSGVERPPGLLELRFAGVGESDLQQEIDARLAEIAGLEVGYCARVGEVDLRLIGDEEAIRRGREIAVGRFARNLFSEDGTNLETTVVSLLAERGWKLATAESCTGGLIANRVTDVPGSSGVFTHGFVTYANEAKRDVLGVPQAMLDEHGAVSEPVARAMAEGALRVSGSDVAVAVTGIAGPGGGSEEKPVGTVFLAFAVKGGETKVIHQLHPRGRKDFKLAVSQAALDGVRKVVHASGLQQEEAGSGGFVGFDPVADGNPEDRRACRKPEACDTLDEGMQVSGGFVRFDSSDVENVKMARRRLPHWSKDGVTYFVTFRLADSMPKEALARWHAKKNEWLELRGIREDESGRVSLEGLPPDHQREYRKLFGEGFQEELDEGYGACYLRKPENARIVAEALEHFDGERYCLDEYVVMPNHVHVLVRPLGRVDLPSIMRSWKTFTSREINGREGRNGRLWQHESFDHIVRNERQLKRIRKYIRENPLKAGLEEGGYLLRA